MTSGRKVLAEDGTVIEVREIGLIYQAWIALWKRGQDSFFGPWDGVVLTPWGACPTDAQVLECYEEWRRSVVGESA